MLAAAVVCPCAPALVPAVSRAGSGRLGAVRDAAITAARWLRATECDALWVIGVGPETRSFPRGCGGSLRRLGVDIAFGGPELALPESLTVGRWLLGDGAAAASFQSLAPDASVDECRSIGERLAVSAPRVAMLVVADGSARRTRQSPGPFDARAESLDNAVRRALARVDTAALLALDPAFCAELWAEGRAGWQMLAGALGEPGGVTVRVDHESAPLGVNYLVVRLATA